MSVEVNFEKCMHCGACVGACPENALFLNDVALEVNENCIECGLCVKGCPVQALSLGGA
ncbi:MAG: 4Fe-4S binding protein [Candidatus Thermoplasmatota archaeon]|nr:4Fe-4S binding protein [Candidatus Thermoplasmatota archaeon]